MERMEIKVAAADVSQGFVGGILVREKELGCSRPRVQEGRGRIRRKDARWQKVGHAK